MYLYHSSVITFAKDSVIRSVGTNEGKKKTLQTTDKQINRPTHQLHIHTHIYVYIHTYMYYLIRYLCTILSQHENRVVRKTRFNIFSILLLTCKYTK